MAFRPPSKMLERVMRFKALTHEPGGKLKLWGIPATLVPNFSNVFLQKLMEKEIGAKKTDSIFYALGKFHSHNTFRMISERFGYATTIQNKEELLQFNTGQGEVVGLGFWEWIKADFKNEIFIMRGRSTFAEEYRRFFGMQKRAVDSLLRGHATAFAEAVMGKPMFGVEKNCIAQGKASCEIVVKPIGKWDKKDKDFIDQQVIKMPTDIKELGSKISAYITPPSN